MKSKDLLMIGGIGLAVYLLFPKAKEAAAAPGITTIIPAPGAPLDIGGLFGGIASIFGAMPAPIVPEINIPEFKLPPIDIPEGGWGGFIPDEAFWRGFIPDWDEMMPDWDKFIPKFPGFPDLITDGGVVETVVDVITGGGNGNGGIFEGVIDAPKKTIEEGAKTWVSFWDTLTDAIAWGNRPWYELFTDPLWLKKPTGEELEIRAESEAIFEEAGFSEVLPSNLDIFIKARETITGEKA
ncbi:unnamed protein product, partial [marine sediment metagenome]